MAASKSYFARSNYRFLPGDYHHHHHHTAVAAADAAAFELDESDFYNSTRSNSPEFGKPISSSSSRLISKKAASKRSSGDPCGDRTGPTVASLPVNIPDWSKILRDEYRDNRRRDIDDDDDDDFDGGDDCDGGVKVPPHEFLARQMARTRIASFSVQEGIGRTLKGRDLSRVRNAIWEKTGFED